MGKTLKCSALAVLLLGLAFTIAAFAKMGGWSASSYVIAASPYLLMVLVIRAAHSPASCWAVAGASLVIFGVAAPANFTPFFEHVSMLASTGFFNLAVIQVSLVMITRLIVWRRNLAYRTKQLIAGESTANASLEPSRRA